MKIKNILKNKKFIASLVTLILLILNESNVIKINNDNIDNIVSIILSLIASGGFLLTDFKEKKVKLSSCQQLEKQTKNMTEKIVVSSQNHNRINL